MEDILIDIDGDVLLKDGDFSVGTSDEQQVKMIIASRPGDWKEHPECGVALDFSRNGRIDRFVERKIRVQLKADGFDLKNLSVSESGITVNGEYKDRQ